MATAPARKHEKDDELSLFPEAADRAAEAWPMGQDEGQLAVDVYETETEIVVKSAIAGVKPENIDVFVQNDMLTIRGSRHDEETVESGRAVVRECHWGAFSRSLILPVEVDAEHISATLKEGILTIRMPKIERSRRITVRER